MTAVINIIPLIKFMALIQCNVTLDINYASEQRMCVHQYTQCTFHQRRNSHQLFYLLLYSGSMVVTPGECNASQLVTLVQ